MRLGGARAARRSGLGLPSWLLGGVNAPLLTMLIVLAAVVMMVFVVPNRGEPATRVSDFGTRTAAPNATVAAPVAATQAVPAAAAPTAGAPAAAGAAAVGPAPLPPASGDTAKPSGSPLRRQDWTVVRDYAANGGPGPNGAVDIGVKNAGDAIGTPVYATQDGVVRLLRNNRLYGNLVAIKNSRWSTTYGHLEQILVAEGQVVKKGDQVGTLGMTGTTTSPVLDYQVWEKVDGQEINRNPTEFLGPRQ
jgi:murein DD-endopeptidase MepM/ murein hydrolase activator NlpD